MCKCRYLKECSIAHNYALDVALAFERTRIKLIDLEKAIKAGVEYLASLKYLIKKSKELL